MLAQDYSSVDFLTVPPIIHNFIQAQVPLVSEESRDIPVKAKVKTDSRYEKEGKRWVRRRENSRFAGNIHIVKPSTQDYSLNLSIPRSTFPKPLPSFLPRHLSAPSASRPLRHSASANAGRYSLSLKGVRRELRRSGPRTEQLVFDIEEEIIKWLETGGVLLSPDTQHSTLSLSAISGLPLGSSKSIIEVYRSPTELIWRIDEDFPRFLLHCVARFHGVVSFSKTTPGPEQDTRLTHLIRPNVTRPDFKALEALDTPPASDIDTLSVTVDTEDSDVTSEFALGSDEGNLASPSSGSHSFLPEEHQVSGVHSLEKLLLDDVESSVGEREDDTLSISVGSLTLEAETQDWEPTPRRRGTQANPLLPRSPSRSESVCQRSHRVAPVRILAENRLRFWQYVFA